MADRPPSMYNAFWSQYGDGMEDPRIQRASQDTESFVQPPALVGHMPNLRTNVSGMPSHIETLNTTRDDSPMHGRGDERTGMKRKLNTSSAVNEGNQTLSKKIVTGMDSSFDPQLGSENIQHLETPVPSNQNSLGVKDVLGQGVLGWQLSSRGRSKDTLLPAHSNASRHHPDHPNASALISQNPKLPVDLSRFPKYDFDFRAIFEHYPQHINFTAVEIIVFLPRLYYNSQIAERFANNYITNPVHLEMWKQHRYSAGEYAGATLTSVANGYLDALRPSNWRSLQKDWSAEKKAELWSRKAHKTPSNWNPQNMRINDFVPERLLRQGMHGPIPMSVPFTDLLAGVQKMPSEIDAADLTRAIEFACGNSIPSTGQPYLFPDHLPLILGIVGHTTITDGHFDHAAAKRYECARSRDGKQNIMVKSPAPIDPKRLMETPFLECQPQVQPPCSFQPQNFEPWAQNFHPSTPSMNVSPSTLQIEPALCLIRTLPVGPSNTPQMNAAIAFANRPSQRYVAWNCSGEHIKQIEQLLEQENAQNLFALRYAAKASAPKSVSKQDIVQVPVQGKEVVEGPILDLEPYEHFLDTNPSLRNLREPLNDADLDAWLNAPSFELPSCALSFEQNSEHKNKYNWLEEGCGVTSKQAAKILDNYKPEQSAVCVPAVHQKASRSIKDKPTHIELPLPNGTFLPTFTGMTGDEYEDLVGEPAPEHIRNVTRPGFGEQ